MKSTLIPITLFVFSLFIFGAATPIQAQKITVEIAPYHDEDGTWRPSATASKVTFEKKSYSNRYVASEGEPLELRNDMDEFQLRVFFRRDGKIFFPDVVLSEQVIQGKSQETRVARKSNGYEIKLNTKDIQKAPSDLIIDFRSYKYNVYSKFRMPVNYYQAFRNTTTLASNRVSMFSDKGVPTSFDTRQTTRINTNAAVDRGYAIQFAVLSYLVDESEFSNLRDIGTVYFKRYNKKYYYRVGSYATESDASRALRAAQRLGYADAFVTDETGRYVEYLEPAYTYPTDNRFTYIDSRDVPKGYDVYNDVPYDLPAEKTGYTVQLVALSKYPDPDNFSKVSSIGEVYTLEENGMYKVRIGNYSSEANAKKALSQVKAKGFKKAFVTEATLPQPDALYERGYSFYDRPVGYDQVATSPRVHVVRKGETLYSIARNYGVSVNYLLSTNRMSPKAILQPGDEIFIR